jgi:hypothetical protein
VGPQAFLPSALDAQEATLRELDVFVAPLRALLKAVARFEADTQGAPFPAHCHALHEAAPATAALAHTCVWHAGRGLACAWLGWQLQSRMCARACVRAWRMHARTW